MEKKIIVVSILGFFAVALGAFGAHGLRPLLDQKMMHAFETAVQYHFYHFLAMGFVMSLKDYLTPKILTTIFNLFFGGIILFSGSLYTIAFAAAGGYSLKFLGPLTPIGGVFFMIAWGLLAYAVYRKPNNN